MLFEPNFNSVRLTARGWMMKSIYIQKIDSVVVLLQKNMKRTKCCSQCLIIDTLLEDNEIQKFKECFSPVAMNINRNIKLVNQKKIDIY